MRSRFFGLIAAALSLWSSGCVTSWPIDPGDPVTLSAGQGLLVVHVQTDRKVRSIQARGVVAAEDVPEGTHLRLIGITAGTYWWSEIELADRMFQMGPYNPYIRYRWRDIEALRFRVEPGAINYVGMIQIEAQGPYSVSMGSIDRTMIGLEELRSRYPDLIAKYPIVYSGPARHEFLRRYLAEVRGNSRAEPSSGSAAKGSSRASGTDPLFRMPALLRVALNPSGTLSYAQGFDGDLQIVTVRNASNGANTTVFTHSGAIELWWDDDDTLIVQTEGRDPVQRYAIDLQLFAYGVVSTQREITARGWLIDPLPLVRDEEFLAQHLQARNNAGSDSPH